MKFGNLEFVPAIEHPELMAPVVFEALRALRIQGRSLNSVGVAEIDPALSDTAAFCEKYGIGMEAAANCVILEARRADRTWLAACVVLGTTRADVNGLGKRTLDAKKVSFAPMESAVAESGMEYGAITPVGLPGWPILVDKAVADSVYVIIGSGIRASKLLVPGSFFSTLPGVVILEGLGQIKQTV
jgi:prolyl-tRNA editing enzyme YbaK/EbsC (Cys-tRNA(Pro) deacylase)